MSLTPEQLLIPRVMCIGTEVGTRNCPCMPYYSGDILEQMIGENGLRYFSKRLQYCIPFNSTYLKLFPHLFRPMPWWEGRKPEEMPVYLKSDDEDCFVVNVKNWLFNNGTMDIWAFEYRWGGDSHDTRMAINGWIPATEAEYLIYQNSNL